MAETPDRISKTFLNSAEESVGYSFRVRDGLTALPNTETGRAMTREEYDSTLSKFRALPFETADAVKQSAHSKLRDRAWGEVANFELVSPMERVVYDTFFDNGRLRDAKMVDVNGTAVREDKITAAMVRHLGGGNLFGGHKKGPDIL